MESKDCITHHLLVTVQQFSSWSCK